MIPVAVTTWHNEEENRCFLEDGYVMAMEQVGLLPLLVSPALSPSAAADILDSARGLLLAGGDDISPLYYKQQPLAGLEYVDARRDELEFALAAEALKRKMPIFAVCRGMQVINVAMGGTLVQHICQSKPDAMQHRQNSPQWHRHHQVTVRPGSLLAQALGEGLVGVNSTHHQAVDEVAEGLIISATTADGMVEAIERANPWLLAVQWHPERMWQRYPEFLQLFRLFAQACQGEKG